MIVILANYKTAQLIAQERGLTRREWIWPGGGNSLRGIAGPLEVLTSPTWYDCDFAHCLRVEDEIARINARYRKPEDSPHGM